MAVVRRRPSTIHPPDHRPPPPHNSTFIIRILQWLSQDGPNAVKHRGVIHPLTTLIIHYGVAVCVTVLAHDHLLQGLRDDANNDTCTLQDLQQLHTLQQRQQTVARWLGLYVCWFFGWRLMLQRPPHNRHLFWAECYRQTFLCSVTLVLSSVGFASNRPIIASAHIIAVGIDQLLWYIDLLGFLTTGRFAIGCTQYLFWDGTTWSSRMTSTHHLWTIPLILWACGGLHLYALPLSFVVVSVNVFLSRWMTPIRIDFPCDEGDVHEEQPEPKSGGTNNNFDEIDKKQQQRSLLPPPPTTTTTTPTTPTTKTLYLNLNLAHELWSDISFQFLLWGEESIPYLIRLLVVWFICNMLVYVLLSFISSRFFGATSINQCVT